MGKTNERPTPALRHPIEPYVNHSMMLGYLSGVLSSEGKITPEDWNEAVQALWNVEARP